MKKIFLVEDDPVVVEIYRKKLLREGFHVDVAEDGLVAMKQIPLIMPDLVVLDLMMPKFNGADVLKFIRNHRDLKNIKVVIFSNAYMTEIALEAAKAGADASLLKSSCTPAQLINVVKTLLENETAVPEKSTLLAAPADPPQTPIPAATPTPAAAPDVARPFKLPSSGDTAQMTREELAKRDFLRNAPGTISVIRELFEQFARSSEPQFRPLRLIDLHRKIHFFTDIAELAKRHRLAHLAGAVEALLFQLQERPKDINPSTIQTIGTALDFLGELVARAPQETEEPPTPTNLLAVLVVDDEPLSNRALVHALSRANVQAASTDNSTKALEMCSQNRYDLLLLDYLMPGMDGLDLYKRLRVLPRYEKTPVIFVTSATDFKQRAHEILALGDDIIQKPILPMELAVKALTLLLKNSLAGN